MPAPFVIVMTDVILIFRRALFLTQFLTTTTMIKPTAAWAALLCVLLCLVPLAASWTSPKAPNQATRLEFLKQAAAAALVVGSNVVASPEASASDGGSSFLASSSSFSSSMTVSESSTNNNKLMNLSNADIEKIVLADLQDRHFLVTGDLTRSIYDESATFTDEIDTYQMDQWMKGTQKLFVGEGSKLNLVGRVEASPSAVEFRFDEDLMFRIPLRPVVHLTGKVVLTRSPETGLITSYREFWDQDVLSVLRSAKI